MSGVFDGNEGELRDLAEQIRMRNVPEAPGGLGKHSFLGFQRF